MPVNLVLCLGLVAPPSPFSAKASQCFELVKRFDPKMYAGKTTDREHIEKELTHRPEALWAVFWGSRHSNADINARCTWILHVWKMRREENLYRELVRAADGDFDRFVTTLLYSSDGLEPFAQAAGAGRTFNKYFINKAFKSMTLVNTKMVVRTPFHDFAEYLEIAKPTVADALSQTLEVGKGRPHLARCGKIQGERLAHSIVLSERNLNLRFGSFSICVCGGDATIDRLISSIVFAAGDVNLGTGDRVLIVAGGKVTVGDSTSNALIITPRKVELGKFARQTNPLGSTSVILDGKPKPAPDLFTFRDLWADYGLEATLTGTQPQISKVSPQSEFSMLFKEGDMVAAAGKKKIESVGQFRRLLRLALDTGEFDFEVERGGKKMNLRADLKKKEP